VAEITARLLAIAAEGKQALVTTLTLGPRKALLDDELRGLE
jgi:hypothetical protein